MTTEQTSEKERIPGPTPFESKLSKGWERFLAHVIEHGFEVGRRTPEDFIRHFPPASIMRGLGDRPELRSNILVICTGVRAKIALKKSAESCGEDLQIALDEDETDAETIVTLFDPDDRVRFMDPQALWTYVTEGDFWSTDPARDPAGHQRAAAHVAYIIDRALKDGLLTDREVVEGITTEKITECLPREALHEIIAGALAVAHEGKPFSEKDLLAFSPPSTLVQHIPLGVLWEQIVKPKIAQRHKLAPGPVPKPAGAAAPQAEKPDASPNVPNVPPAKAPDANLSDARALDASKLEAQELPAGILEDGDLDMDIDDVLDNLEARPDDDSDTRPPPSLREGKSNGKSESMPPPPM